MSSACDAKSSSPGAARIFAGAAIRLPNEKPSAAEHANIDSNLSKTRVWEAAGKELEGLAAELPLPGRPPVWVGAHSLPAEQQGMVVVGKLWGSDAFVDAFLNTKARVHSSLLSKIPAIPDLQVVGLSYIGPVFHASIERLLMGKPCLGLGHSLTT